MPRAECGPGFVFPRTDDSDWMLYAGLTVRPIAGISYWESAPFLTNALANSATNT